MGVLMTLLTLPVLGPLRSLAWIAARVDEQARRELYDPDTVRRELEELELRRDLGEIDEGEHAVAEEKLLARLVAIREHEAAEGMRTTDQAG